MVVKVITYKFVGILSVPVSSEQQKGVVLPAVSRGMMVLYGIRRCFSNTSPFAADRIKISE